MIVNSSMQPLFYAYSLYTLLHRLNMVPLKVLVFHTSGGVLSKLRAFFCI